MQIKRSYDRLISTMGFPILVRRHLYFESGLTRFCRHMLVEFRIRNMLEVCLPLITQHPQCWNILTPFQYKVVSPGVGISILKVSWSWDQRRNIKVVLWRWMWYQWSESANQVQINAKQKNRDFYLSFATLINKYSYLNYDKWPAKSVIYP